jgi:hypothetical protein
MDGTDCQELQAKIKSLEDFYRDISNQCWNTADKWRFARKQRDICIRQNWKDLSAMAGLIARDLARLSNQKDAEAQHDLETRSELDRQNRERMEAEDHALAQKGDSHE